MADLDLNVYPILLAGGTGTRLWPVSRELYPKQLVKFIGDDSLLQVTIKRLEPVLDTENVKVVCGQQHFHETAKHIEKLGLKSEGKLIREPSGRNTAPAILLAALVGVSVLVPYIGAAVVTVPIAIVAYFQFGWGTDFAIVLIVYGIIQALDGNVLVPLLFSEVVNLHPVAIIVAILVFGGIWGFWGVFFAIPLATLVQAILVAWPRHDTSQFSDAAGPGAEPATEDA